MELFVEPGVAALRAAATNRAGRGQDVPPSPATVDLATRLLQSLRADAAWREHHGLPHGAACFVHRATEVEIVIAGAHMRDFETLLYRAVHAVNSLTLGLDPAVAEDLAQWAAVARLSAIAARHGEDDLVGRLARGLPPA